MLTALFIGLLLSSLSGLWLWQRWRQEQAELPELRVMLHGLCAAAVLVALLLGLDHQGRGDGLRLLLIFLAISTGMLLFLKRQRQRQFPQSVLRNHVIFGLAALLFVGWSLLA